MARQRPGAGPTGAVQDRKFVTGTHNQTLDLKDGKTQGSRSTDW